jgi:hypothetical protein
VLLLNSAVRLGIALVAFDVLGLTISVTLGFTLPFAVVITVARVLAVANVFRVTLVRAARAVAVAAITTAALIVTVSAGRELASRTTGRGARTAATR